MAEISIKSSQALEDVINELSRLREDFHKKAADIDQEEKRLVANWTGTASNALNERWSREYGNFDTLYEVLGEYIEGLRTIKTTYEEAEKTNTAIAQQ